MSDITRRIARFRVSSPLLREEPELLLEAFAALKILPVRVEYLFETNSYEYTAMSPAFDVLADYCVPVVGDILCRRKSGEPTFYEWNSPGGGNWSIPPLVTDQVERLSHWKSPIRAYPINLNTP